MRRRVYYFAARENVASKVQIRFVTMISDENAESDSSCFRIVLVFGHIERIICRFPGVLTAHFVYTEAIIIYFILSRTFFFKII